MKPNVVLRDKRGRIIKVIENNTGFKKGHKINLGRKHTEETKKLLCIVNGTPARRKISSVTFSKILKGNNFRKEYLKKLSSEKRKIYMRKMNDKIGITMQTYWDNHPEVKMRFRQNMLGNTLVLDWRKKHYPEKYKVYEIFKSYNPSFVKFTGELKFNPLVNGRAWFLKYGLSTPNAPYSPPTNTF